MKRLPFVFIIIVGGVSIGILATSQRLHAAGIDTAFREKPETSAFLETPTIVERMTALSPKT